MTIRHFAWSSLNKTFSFIAFKDGTFSFGSLMYIITSIVNSICVETFFWFYYIMDNFHCYSSNFAVTLNHILTLIWIFCVVFEAMLDGIISCALDVTFIQIRIKRLPQNFTGLSRIVVDVRLTQSSVH